MLLGPILIKKTCTLDAIIILLLSDSVIIGSSSILKWAKVLCDCYNMSFWKFCILVYCHKNAEWLYVCSDVEMNPGETDDNNFRLMHWNPNTIVTDDFSRVSLIQAYNAIYDFHIISITESALKENM